MRGHRNIKYENNGPSRQVGYHGYFVRSGNARVKYPTIELTYVT